MRGKRNSERLPQWSRPCAAGLQVGRSQALDAYAAYYCLDGSADADESIEERLPLIRPPLRGYASRTGTLRNLRAMADADWRLLVSAKGCLRTEGMPYAMDNGAWSAYQQGVSFDERAFGKAVDLLGAGADWIVLPDIVAGGQRSLDYSVAWMQRLRGLSTPLLLAVQDGMSINEVRDLLSPSVGIFIGGTTSWKEETAQQWGALARRRNCYLHVGRVNSQRRIAICAAAGADSFDGTSVTRFAKSITRLDSAKRQGDLFAASASWSDVDPKCASSPVLQGG